jgi:hypothetical protein
VEEFIEQVESGWKADEDTVAACSGKDIVAKWYEAYGEAYASQTSKKM